MTGLVLGIKPAYKKNIKLDSEKVTVQTII